MIADAYRQPTREVGQVCYIAPTVARQRSSYAWSFHTEVGNVPVDSLSPAAQEGLACARDLARDARDRSTRALQGETLAPLTITAIAAEEGIAPKSARRWIEQARHELFGQITDNAIYKRKQRPRTTTRPCQQPDCHQQLPPGTHANRRYCDHHGSPAQRGRRHRQQAAHHT